MRLRNSGTQFFLALFVLLGTLSAVVFFGLRGLSDVARVTRQVFSDNLQTAQATSKLGTDLNRVQSTSLEIVGLEGDPSADRLRAELVVLEIPAVESDIGTILRLHAGDPPGELAQVKRIPREWQGFMAFAQGELLLPDTRFDAGATRVRTMRTINTTLGALASFVSERQPIERRDAATAHAGAQLTYSRARAGLIVTTILAIMAAALMIRIGIGLNRILKEQELERRYEESASEFSAILQGTENEAEAQQLLRRQVERLEPGARAVILGRNNSHDRLEARTSTGSLSELDAPLEGAAPRSCLAVRFGRPHEEGAVADQLARCELCSALPNVSTCEPLLVGGAVIGSVLVNHVSPPTGRERQKIQDAVAQAAPALANLRNLAIAELRAATDRLTGLANHRAVEETFKRMVAQALRTATPLAAVLFDLDHFKRINDLCGHDRGNDVLAAVGVALRQAVRGSDFVGRYGGEEFLLLLPSTDREGAIHVAEVARAAIAGTRVATVEQTVTASAGVAVLPADGLDSEALFRAVDKALYAAKKAGRDRVCVAEAPSHPVVDVSAIPVHVPGGDAPEVPAATPAEE